jgi:hypothetical protein
MIQPIVEGHGELPAFPVLLRRLTLALGVPGCEISRPIRAARSDLSSEARLRRRVQLAKRQPGCKAIIVLFDADDDCPRVLVPKVLRWVREECASAPCDVVLANREYEAWFIAGLEELARDPGRGLRPDARSPADPEAVRDAKGYISGCLTTGRSYLPRVDQPRYSAVFDTTIAYARCRSFRKLVAATSGLLRALGASPNDWPQARTTGIGH